MNEAIWWYGLVCLCITLLVGTAWMLDQSIDWILTGFKLRAAFFRWYVDRLRNRAKLKEETDGQ